MKSALTALREKYLSSGGLVNIFANTAWLFADKVIRMGVGMLVGVWMARYLGPNDFGIFNYATAYASFFGILAGLGLDAIVVRELVRLPENENLILGNAFFAKLGAGLLVILLALGILMIYPQPWDIRIYILIITAGFVFQSLDIIDFYFQAKVMSKFVVIARNISFVILSIVKVVLIVKEAALIWFVYCASIELGLSALFLVIAFWYNKKSISNWNYDRKYMFALVKEAFPLVLSGFVIIIYMRIGQIMLGNFLDQASVGVYSAASKLAEIWYFIPTIICSSVLPSIIRARTENIEKYNEQLRTLYSVLNAISLSIALVTTFIASFVIELLYGDAYLGAAEVLSISIWTGIFTFLSVGTGQYLIVENFTRIAFFRNLISALINVALNVFLIPKYGAPGAALATLISYFFSVFSLVFFPSTRGHVLVVIKSLFFGVIR